MGFPSERLRRTRQSDAWRRLVRETVLTTDDPPAPGTQGLDYGITTIQGVSQLIWGNLQH